MSGSVSRCVPFLHYGVQVICQGSLPLDRVHVGWDHILELSMEAGFRLRIRELCDKEQRHIEDVPSQHVHQSCI